MTRFALLLLAVTAWASPRTVNGPLQNPSNSGANGTVTVEWQTFTAGDGSLIVAGTRTTAVSSGTYSQSFEPTQDAAPSGVTYKVTYRFGSSSPSICYWSIPSGAGSVLIADIQTCTPPSSPAGTIALSQLSIGGGSNGQCAIISAGIWAPGSCTASWTVNGNDIYNSNTANVGIGATPGNYKFDVSKSGSSGTVRVFDQTASTGVTAFAIWLGAGQSTTSPFNIFNASGVEFSGIDTVGEYYVRASAGGSKKSAIITTGLGVTSDSVLAFRSTSSLDTGTYDTSLGRNAAGVIEANNGTLGVLRDFTMRNILMNGQSGSSELQIIAGSGQSTTPFIQVQDSTNTNTRFNVAYEGAQDTNVVANISAANGNYYGAIVLRSGGGGGAGDHAQVNFASGNTSKWQLSGIRNGIQDLVITDPEASNATRFKITKSDGSVTIPNLGGSGSKYVCVDNNGKLTVGSTC